MLLVINVPSTWSSEPSKEIALLLTIADVVLDGKEVVVCGDVVDVVVDGAGVLGVVEILTNAATMLLTKPAPFLSMPVFPLPE